MVSVEKKSIVLRNKITGLLFIACNARLMGGAEITLTIKIMKKILTFAAALLFVVSVYAAGFPDITIQDLKPLMDAKKVVIIDVNGTESWQKGHIPGAIDFTSTKDLASVLPKEKDTLIVAYCANPKCGAYQKAAKAAQALGYTNVKHLSAGISGWQQAGETMEKGS